VGPDHEFDASPAAADLLALLDDGVEPWADATGHEHDRATDAARRAAAFEEFAEALAADPLLDLGRAREQVDGLRLAGRVLAAAVGPEHPVGPERAMLDGQPRGAGRRFVTAARDQVRAGLADRREGPLGRAHDQLSGAREHLPQHKADRIAGA